MSGRPHSILGPSGGMVHPGRVADPLVLERLIRQLPDVPAVEVVMQAFGYRSPAYRLGKHLALLRKRWEAFHRAHAAKATP